MSNAYDTWQAYDVFKLCMLAYVVLVVMASMLSMLFRHLVSKHRDMGPPGHISLLHMRLESRMLVGAQPIPRGAPTYLAWIMRGLAVLFVIAHVVLFYMAISLGPSDAGDIRSTFDPSSKTALFWAFYGLAVLAVLLTSLASVMVLRHDPRPVENEDRLDRRRLVMAFAMIFQDRPVPTDRWVRRLRTACRCLALALILDALLTLWLWMV